MATTCRSCDAPIIWARTNSDRLMPVDAQPSEGGNVELLEERGATLAVVHAQPPFLAGPLHMPHHATCPDGDTWRTR